MAWVVPALLVDSVLTPSCPCEASGLNPLDRGVAGVQRTAPALASDVMLFARYPLGFRLDGLDVGTSAAPWTGWIEDSIVMAEALALSGAATGLVKIAAGRPRPFLYGRKAGDPALRDAHNYTSFFSGHTSSAFAVGLSYAQTFAFRHPQSAYRFVVYAAAVGLGSTVGALRMLAGKHFPTDVLAGAGVGAAIGLLVPWLHLRAPSLSVAAVPSPGGTAFEVYGALP